MIITSVLFPSAKFSLERLRELSTLVGKDRLVVDLRCVVNACEKLAFTDHDAPSSCRKRDSKWLVAMNKWQDITDTEVCKGKDLARGPYRR